MQWVRENDKPYRLELHYEPGVESIVDVMITLNEGKKWCGQNDMMVWNDALLSLRFINERDLFWFLMRWS